MHRVLQGSLFQVPLQAASIINSCSSSTQLHRAAPQTCFPEMPKYFQALISYESNLRKMQLQLRIQVLTIPHRAHLPYAVPGHICSQIPARTMCFRPLPRHIKFLPYIIFSSVLFSSSLLPFCHKKRRYLIRYLRKISNYDFLRRHYPHQVKGSKLITSSQPANTSSPGFYLTVL